MVIGETASVGSLYTPQSQVETPDNVSLQQSERQAQAEATRTQEAQSGGGQQQNSGGSSTADANRDGRAFQFDLTV